MIYKGKDPIEGQEKTSEELFSDEKTDEKIRRHFSDINDVITEEDIANVKTDFDTGIETTIADENAAGAASPTEGNPDDNGEDVETKDAANEPGSTRRNTVTPWNLVDP